MIAIHDSVVQAAIRQFKTDLDKHTVALQSRLKTLLKKSSGKPRQYTAHLISISGKLIYMSPTVLDRERRNFNAIIDPDMMESKKYESFRNKLLTALGYNKQRSDFYPKYFQAIGIKSCVYCNSQLTVTIEVDNIKGKKELIGKFQVDHYLAKARYPCFSVSLYNLYPCCGSCNNIKRKNSVDFLLYSRLSSITKSAYKFTIDPASVTNYLLSGKSDDIVLYFSEPGKKKGMQTFDETFGIKGIYNTQKDLAEELIIKAKIYTDSFKKGLEKQFKGLFPRPGFIEQMIMGNYYLDKDMHKRPFSKFSMDIARDLGLIK